MRIILFSTLLAATFVTPALASVEEIQRLSVILIKTPDAAEQKKLLDPVFAGLATPHEKIAFLNLDLQTYSSPIPGDLFAQYAISFVHDPDSAVRARAANALSRSSAVKYIADIETLSADTNESVRAAAAEALHLGGVNELARLNGLLENDPSKAVAISAILSLGEIARDSNPSADARAQLLEAIASQADKAGLESTVIQALLLARVTGKEPRLLERLTAFTADSDAATRTAALNALSELNAASQTPAVVKALDDKDVTVRLAAISALAQFKDRRALPRLLELLNDSQSVIACSAIAAIGDFGDRAQAPVLAKLLTNDDANRRRAAVSALVALHDPETFGVLGQYFNDPNYMVRCTAIQNASSIWGPEAGAKVSPFLFDEDRSVRQTAENVLIQLKAWDQAKTVREQSATHIGEKHNDMDFLDPSIRFLKAAENK